MAASYQLSIQVAGLQQVQALTRQVQQLRQVQQQLKALPPPGGGGGGSNLPVTKVVRPPRITTPSGPFARLAAARQNLANNLNDPDAQYRYIQAQQSAQRAQNALNGGPAFPQRLQTAILSTRFNIGGQRFGVSPLVGRTLQAAGLSGGQAAGATVAIAAVVLAFQAATLGVKLFIEAVKTAVTTLHEMSSARTITGGTSGNIAALQAMGIGAGQIPGLANSLAGNLSGGSGLAMGTFGAQLPGVFGPSDRSATLQRVVQDIASTADPIQRLTKARIAELDSILPQIEAYRRSKGVIDADAKARAAIADPETMRAADDFQLALGRVGFNFQSLLQAIGKPALKDFTAGLMVLGDVIRAIAQELNNKPQIIMNVLNAFKAIFGFFIRLIWGDKGMKILSDAYNKSRADLDAASAQVDASNRVAASLDNLAGILTKPGFYGGGPNAQGALPPALRGRALDQALAGGAMRLGAFAL